MGTRAKVKGQKVIKKDLIASATQCSRLKPAYVSHVIEEVLTEIGYQLRFGNRIHLRGYFDMEPVVRARIHARNPRTGVPVEVPVRMGVRVTFHKEMK